MDNLILLNTTELVDTTSNMTDFMAKLKPYQTTFYTLDDDFNDNVNVLAAILKIDRCGMESDVDHVACEDGLIVPDIELFESPLFENREDSN